MGALSSHVTPRCFVGKGNDSIYGTFSAARHFPNAQEKYSATQVKAHEDSESCFDPTKKVVHFQKATEKWGGGTNVGPVHPGGPGGMCTSEI